VALFPTQPSRLEVRPGTACAHSAPKGPRDRTEGLPGAVPAKARIRGEEAVIKLEMPPYVSFAGKVRTLLASETRGYARR